PNCIQPPFLQSALVAGCAWAVAGPAPSTPVTRATVAIVLSSRRLNMKSSFVVCSARQTLTRTVHRADFIGRLRSQLRHRSQLAGRQPGRITWTAPSEGASELRAGVGSGPAQLRPTCCLTGCSRADGGARDARGESGTVV